MKYQSDRKVGTWSDRRTKSPQKGLPQKCRATAHKELFLGNRLAAASRRISFLFVAYISGLRGLLG
jgi:hypothetical protein